MRARPRFHVRASLLILAALAGIQGAHTQTPPGKSWVSLATVPPGATVHRDSLALDVTPLTFAVDRDSITRLTVTMEGYEPVSRLISPGITDTLRLTTTLRSSYGWLRTRAAQPNSSWTIDDGDPAPAAPGYIRVPPGKHWVHASAGDGARSISRSVVLLAGDSTDCMATLGQPSSTSLILSAVLPGLGQMYDRSVVKGCAFMIGIGGLIAARQWYFGERRDEQAAYTAAFNRYSSAATNSEAEKYRGEMNDHVSRANANATRVNIATGLAVAVYLANLADAYLNHGQDDAMTVSYSRWLVVSPYISGDIRGTGIDISIQLPR
jgi:hypothetical protein